MKRIVPFALVSWVSFALAAPLLAHHGPVAYNTQQEIKVTGVVKLYSVRILIRTSRSR